MTGRILVCGWVEGTQRGKFVFTLKDGEYFWSKILLAYARVLGDENPRISATFPFLTRVCHRALQCDLTCILSMFKWLYKSGFWHFLQLRLCTQVYYYRDQKWIQRYPFYDFKLLSFIQTRQSLMSHEVILFISVHTNFMTITIILHCILKLKMSQGSR